MNYQIILAFFSIQADAFNRFCRGQNCRSIKLTEHECIVISKDIFNEAFMKDPKSIFSVGNQFEECEFIDRFYHAYLMEKFPSIYAFRL